MEESALRDLENVDLMFAQNGTPSLPRLPTLRRLLPGESAHAFCEALGA